MMGPPVMEFDLQAVSKGRDNIVIPSNNPIRAEQNVRGAANESHRASLLPQVATARQKSTGVQSERTVGPSEKAVFRYVERHSSKPRPVPSVVGKPALPREKAQKQAVPQTAKTTVDLGQGRLPVRSSAPPVSHPVGLMNPVPRSSSPLKPAAQSKHQPSPRSLSFQTQNSLGLSSAQSVGSCVLIDVAKSEDHCDGRVSDHTIGTNGSLPKQNDQKHLDSGQGSKRQMTKNASPLTKGITSAQAPNRHLSIKNQKPPFSTFQQRFSPTTGLKTPVISLSAQAGANFRIASTEVFQSQVELTQLYLLYRSAAAVHSQWLESADQSIESHFVAVSERHRHFQRYIQGHRASINQSALLNWYEGTSSAEFSQDVQLLSRNVLELHRLLDSGAKYPSILRRFESWLSNACHLRDSRKHAHALEQNTEYIESIGDDWRAEIAILEKKLATCSRELACMRKPQENSALGHAISGFQTMVTNCLDELDTIQIIESDVLAQEMLHVECQIHEIYDTSKLGTGLLAPSPDLGLWNIL